ncbi:unnamed protein product [Ectocarpus sp. 12 AP-2014]
MPLGLSISQIDTIVRRILSEQHSHAHAKVAATSGSGLFRWYKERETESKGQGGESGQDARPAVGDVYTRWFYPVRGSGSATLVRQCAAEGDGNQVSRPFEPWGEIRGRTQTLLHSPIALSRLEREFVMAL